MCHLRYIGLSIKKKTNRLGLLPFANWLSSSCCRSWFCVLLTSNCTTGFCACALQMISYNITPCEKICKKIGSKRRNKKYTGLWVWNTCCSVCVLVCAIFPAAASGNRKLRLVMFVAAKENHPPPVKCRILWAIRYKKEQQENVKTDHKKQKPLSRMQLKILMLCTCGWVYPTYIQELKGAPHALREQCLLLTSKQIALIDLVLSLCNLIQMLCFLKNATALQLNGLSLHKFVRYILPSNKMWLNAHTLWPSN